MELKKSPSVDLENKRIYFILIGLIVSLLLSIGAFSWSVKEKVIEQTETVVAVAEQEIVEVTVQEDKRPPAPIKTQAVVLSDMINVVKNDTKIEQDLTIFDMDMDQLAVDVTKFGGTYTGPAEEVVDEEMPLVFAEEMPKFMGKDGQTEFSRWCQHNLTYPPIALDNGVQGRVTVSFVVERDGQITNIKLMRGVDRELDKAALEIVKKSPKKWTPAKNNGRAVRLMIQMPIVFKLE